MKNRSINAFWTVLALILLAGCAKTPRSIDIDNADADLSQRIAPDRQAILGMAGTFKVTFDFEESIALRDGHQSGEPYHVEAEELVVVAEDAGGAIGRGAA